MLAALQGATRVLHAGTEMLIEGGKKREKLLSFLASTLVNLNTALRLSWLRMMGIQHLRHTMVAATVGLMTEV